MTPALGSTCRGSITMGSVAIGSSAHAAVAGGFTETAVAVKVAWKVL